MASPPSKPKDPWSDDRPLLRWGLGLLRRWSRNHRYAYLYPDGPNPKVVFEAFQSFSTKRMIQDESRPPASPRALRRRFKKHLRKCFIQDAWDRDTRVRHKLPITRPSAIDGELPVAVRAAMQEVRPDARVQVASFLTDRRSGEEDPTSDQPFQQRRRLAVGLQDFREALTSTLLDQPQTLLTIHPQYLYFVAPPLPWTVSDPWRSWLFVRLPLQVFAVFSLVFFSAYGWAYYRFNDEVLAEFLTEQIGSVIDGELDFGKVHWGPTLALDLLIRRAHKVDVYDVKVYEGYKYVRREEGGPLHGQPAQKRVTAYAEHLEAKLVLHEIIPWNRLGVPRVFNIPWILHFTELNSLGKIWIGARSYFDTETQSQKISLTDAFGPSDDSPSTQGYRSLSFRVDDTHFPTLTVPLDFLEDGEWASSMDLYNTRIRLRYDGDYPEQEQEDDEMPLKYLVNASGGKGQVVMLDEVFALNQIHELELGAGYGNYPMGDLSAVLRAEVEGSDCELSGGLTDVFREKSGVDTRMLCTGPDGLFTTIMPVEPGDTGPILAGGKDGQVVLEISGSLADPLLEFQAESIALDPQLGTELRVQEVDLVAQLRSQTIAPAMRELYTQAGADTPHWTVVFEQFNGQLMKGQVSTPISRSLPRLILPNHAEPFVFSGAFELDPLDLSSGGKMVPSFYQSAEGDLQVKRLVFGETLGAAGPAPKTIPITERFGEIWPVYRPTSGPGYAPPGESPPMTLQVLDLGVPDLVLQDPKEGMGLPSRVDVEGDFSWNSLEGLRVDNANFKVPGARLNADLKLSADLNHVKRASLDLELHDGETFFTALDLPTFTKELRSELQFSGPLKKLSGPPGKLHSPGANIAGLDLRGLDKASLQWKRGALILDAPELLVLGGKGPLRAEFWPNWGGKGDPKMKARLSLRSLAQEQLLGWPVSFSNAQLDFVIDDGKGKPRSIHDFHARGHAFIPKLTMAKVRYHNARAAFVVTPDQIEVDELSLRYGRALSPKLAPQLRVSTGFFSVRGSLGLSEDPSLDLQVRSSGLPLRALTNFAGGTIPVRGRIGQGSSVTLKGSMSQPQVEGNIHLASVNAANLALGRGKLEFTSHRRSQGSGRRRLDIREVKVKGQLKTSSQTKEGLRIDASLAVGRDRKGSEFRELSGKGSISTVPLKQLLTLPHQDRWQKQIQGELQDLSIEASYCPSAQTMLPACEQRKARRRSTDRQALKDNALALDLRLERAWAGIRPKSATAPARRTRCPAFASACMKTPLFAQLNEGTLNLRTPWELLTGPARARSSLLVQGTFDLRSPKEEPSKDQCPDFLARLSSPRSSIQPRSGATRAEVRGAVDLSGLDPAILPLRWGPMRGRVDLDLELYGPLVAPWVRGEIKNQSPTLTWTLERTENEQQQPIQLQVKALDVDVQGETATIQTQVNALRGHLDFGRGPLGVTGVGLTGACRGQYSVNMGPQSKIDARLFSLLFPEEIDQSAGSIGIPQFSMGGNWRHPFQAGAPAVNHLQARLSMAGHNAEFSVADQDLRVPSGEVDIRLCQPGDLCSGERGDQGLAIRIGSDRDSSRPMDALGFQSDSSGRTQYIWGQVTVPPNLQSLHFAQLSVALDQFPYRQDDNAGRPELVARLSSEDLRLRVTPDGFRRVSGNLSADKARWLRDASQGVRSVVSFADPVPRPPSTLSPTLAGLELDVNLKTTSPFRVDNNILRGLEAQAELHLGGTVGTMEVTGPIEVQQGVLDLALLGGAYAIDHGRVRLNRRIADSVVDISATREAPVRIDNELHQVTLELDGALDAIRWRCHSTAQRNRGLQTLRGCIDYLIFDAGNAALTPQEEIDTGSLNLTRRSLTLFGNLTQVELNRFVEDELPRTGEFLPIVRGRVRQLGLELSIQTREDWFSWRWGRLGLGYSYLRGYSGSFLRASQSLSSQLHLLEDVALEMQLGLRNYSNVALVLQPPRFGSVELGHRIRIPGIR